MNMYMLKVRIKYHLLENKEFLKILPKSLIKQLKDLLKEERIAWVEGRSSVALVGLGT